MTKEKLLVLDKSIEYTVRESKRAKRLRVAVYADGDVVATKPNGVGLEIVRKFVESKKLWIAKRLEEKKIQIVPELKENSRMHFLLNWHDSLALVKTKLEKWNEFFGYEYKRVRIKQLKSRWGSCSSSKELSFNYKIIFLPEIMQDYIIVHELCHLKEMNHSKKFWALVKSAIPNYQVIKKKMRTI